MTELTERQIKILKVIIEEYMEVGQPVGSANLEKKYELGVSPATVRNEMVRLTETGYLKKTHASAGRMPTKQAFKFYVDQLMEEKQLSVADEVSAKEKVWDARFNFDHLMREAVKSLAKKANYLVLAATNDGDIYHAGYANILDIPEFYDIDVTRAVLTLLDEANEVQKIFEKCFGEGPIHLLLGEELGYKYLEPCGMVFTQFQVDDKRSGFLGVIGPDRLNYPTIIPLVRYFGGLIEELTQNL